MDYRPPCSPHFLRPARISLLCAVLNHTRTQPGRASLRASCVQSHLISKSYYYYYLNTHVAYRAERLNPFLLCALPSGPGRLSRQFVRNAGTALSITAHLASPQAKASTTHTLSCHSLPGGDPRDPHCSLTIQSSSQYRWAGTSGSAPRFGGFRALLQVPCTHTAPLRPWKEE